MPEVKSSLLGKIILVVVIIGSLYAAYYFLSKKDSPKESDSQTGTAKAADSTQWKGNPVELGIAYGTEKRAGSNGQPKSSPRLRTDRR